MGYGMWNYNIYWGQASEVLSVTWFYLSETTVLDGVAYVEKGVCKTEKVSCFLFKLQKFFWAKQKVAAAANVASNTNLAS